MKRIILGITLSVLAGFSFGQDKRAEAILDQMSRKYQNLNTYSVSFTYGVEGANAKITQPSRGTVTVKGSKFRLKMAGQEVFNNGSEVYTYVKEANEVNITGFNPDDESDFSPTRIYNLYKKGYKYAFKEEQKAGNQVYEVVELLPVTAKSDISKVQITVDKKDKSIKSWKIWDKSGRKTVFSLDNFVPNVPVADQDFTFDAKKYPGVEVVDLR